MFSKPLCDFITYISGKVFILLWLVYTSFVSFWIRPKNLCDLISPSSLKHIFLHLILSIILSFGGFCLMFYSLCFQSMIQSRKAGLAHTLATRSSLNDEELVSLSAHAHKHTLMHAYAHTNIQPEMRIYAWIAKDKNLLAWIFNYHLNLLP